MSSETQDVCPVGHCLFCSLGCQLQLEQFAPQRWRPTYTGNGSSHQLCARGQMLGDLIHQPSRVYRAMHHGREQSLDEA